MTTDSSRLRRRSSAGLFILAFVLVVVAGPALYVSTVIADEDAFVAVADRVVAHPDVRQAIATEVTELTFAAVEADETIAELLPESARTFSVPLTQIASEQLTNAAFRLLDTDLAVAARSSALREVHRQVTTDSDQVVVDLRAVLVRTGREIGGPTIGAGLAKVVAGSDAGRFTLAEADSPESSLLATVRGVPEFGWMIGAGALLVLVAAVVVSPDRRRSTVIAGFVLASAAIVATLVVSAVLYALFAGLAGSQVGSAVVEVVSADFAQQQRGAVLYGLVLATIGMVLGNRPAAVALRGLPAGMFRRRHGSLDAASIVIRDNPAVARVVVWSIGLFTLLAWSTPTWRVVLTVMGLTAVGQAVIWVVVNPSDNAMQWRTRLRIGEAHPQMLATTRRYARVNAAVLILGAFLFWPDWTRTVVIGFFILGAVAEALLDLPEARRVARANDVVVERTEPATRRPRYVIAGVVALVALIAAGFATGATVEAAATSTECNGSVQLCDRRIDEVVFAGSHNSMSSSDLSWDLALQTGDMVTQLDYGVRALLIDAHYWTSDGGTLEGGEDAAVSFLVETALSDDEPQPGTWLCHGFCALGATDLTAGLTDVDLWLESHPREVVIMIVQDEISVADLTAAFEDSGLLARSHIHRTGTPLPTLQELIDADERLLVYAENAGEPDTWLQNGYADTFGETPFTFALRSEFSCAPNRGGAGNPLLLINHWLTTGIPVREAAAAVNSRSALLARVRDCEAERGRLPTILATDFVQSGDLIEVVAELNEAGG